MLAIRESRAEDSTSDRRQNMYSVVRVTVKETRQYCPFYQPGDVFFVCALLAAIWLASSSLFRR